MPNLFDDGVMREDLRAKLIECCEQHVRHVLRDFRSGGEDGVPASDIDDVSVDVASALAQLLWEHDDERQENRGEQGPCQNGQCRRN
jgi:hypothetical protein